MKEENCWIQTYTGKQFFPFNPKSESIDIIDIAFSLGKKCRFNGHTIGFYSVAEHSLSVCELLERQELPPKICLWGLLHDASEAYTGDISGPIKPFLSGFKKIEENIEKCIAKKFKLPWPISPIVKRADLRLLSIEAYHVMKTPHPAKWDILFCRSTGIKINNWNWQEATKSFLNKCAYFGIIEDNDLQKISL